MAIIYNPKDNVWYGTSTQRGAAAIAGFPETSKFYETDTKLIYILYEGAWVAM